MCLCLPYFIPWHSDFHLIIPLKQLLSKSQPFLITYWNRTCSDLCHWIFQPSPLESLTPYFLTYCLLLISAAAFVWISSARRHLLFFFFFFWLFLNSLLLHSWIPQHSLFNSVPNFLHLYLGDVIYVHAFKCYLHANKNKS